MSYTDVWMSGGYEDVTLVSLSGGRAVPWAEDRALGIADQQAPMNRPETSVALGTLIFAA